MKKNIFKIMIIVICSLLSNLQCFAEIMKSNIGGAKIILVENEEQIENPYIIDGLVAMWDGEWNAGLGIHDPNLPVADWKTLVNSDRISRTIASTTITNNWAWGDDGKSIILLPSAKNGASVKLQFSLSGILAANAPFTINVCLKGAVCSLSGFSDNKSFAAYGMGTFRVKLTSGFSYLGGYGGYTADLGDAVTSTVVCDFNVTRGYRNASSGSVGNGGVSQNVAVEGASDSPLLVNVLGGRWYWPVGSKMYSLRIYNRALTSEEIAYNYMIDCERFGL